MDISKFLLNYGLGGLIIAIITIILTGLIKSPIKKKLEEKAEKIGLDKSVYTKWLSFLPLVIAFIGCIINVSACNNWANPFITGAFDWKICLSETVAVWGLSVAFYETGDNFLKSIISKKTTTTTETTEEETTEEVVLTKEEKKIAKYNEKIEKLQSKINALKGEEEITEEDNTTAIQIVDK